MPIDAIHRFQWKPRPAVSIALFVALVGGMAWLRLYIYADRAIPLAYGLALLICVWYPSRRLLWSLTLTLGVMAGFKALVVLPRHAETNFPGYAWEYHLFNLVCIAGTVHVIINLLDHLRAKHAELERRNMELLAHEEEISRQNEELQTQEEELSQRNEAIQQQSEELQQQTEELQAAHAEGARRQVLLENLLQAKQQVDGTDVSPRTTCESLLNLFPDAAAATLILRQGDKLVVQATAGTVAPDCPPWPPDRSLTAVVLEHSRTAAVADLNLRPDLAAPLGSNGRFRAALASPLRLAGGVAGVIEIYSEQPQQWTSEQFQIIEWAAAQCSLVLESQRLHDEVVAANSALETQVRQRTVELQEMVNELEHFSYTITHDMRAPLRAMHGYAGLLEEECKLILSDSGHRYLQRIANAASRMDQLITDALSYSKAIRHELVMEPVNPTTLLRSMMDSYPVFQMPSARIELAGEIPPVFANEAGLTQCFSNLLANAVKFVPPGRTPHVRIHAELRDGFVRLWFEDNGIGIAPAMQPKLFKMFQRLSKDYEGTGIGLALVRKVAERMGGQVGVVSEIGRGSRFWLELKACQ
ncbi:MAG: hypothetical protein RIQ93_2557 [Verrucomicrobiota bacterium]|jgi:signal transduction histidine kinase